MEEITREMTVAEEIKSLDIEERTRERILKKAVELERAFERQDNYLHNCHLEIDRLKGAIVELSKMINLLAEEKRNIGIHCDY